MQIEPERKKQALDRDWSEPQKFVASTRGDISVLSGRIAGVSQIHSPGVNNASRSLMACIEQPQKASSNCV
jgi:hypothetical protein